MAKRKLKTLHKVLLGLLLLILVLGIVTLVYINDYYRASDYVETIIEETSDQLTMIDNMTIIEPTTETKVKTGLIFYPGGKVESRAYMPLLIQLADKGITTVLIDMPANLAVLNIDAAKDVFNEELDIDKWYLAGHSLGGAMASQFMEDNYALFEGLILLGAYPVNEAPIDTLAIYGTYDIMLDLEKTAQADEVVEITNGNHANFGDYGDQEGDGKALITREEQQEQTVKLIMDFILK